MDDIQKFLMEDEEEAIHSEVDVDARTLELIELLEENSSENYERRLSTSDKMRSADNMIKETVRKLKAEEGEMNSQEAAYQSQRTTKAQNMSTNMFAQARQPGQTIYLNPLQMVSLTTYGRVISQSAQDYHFPGSYEMKLGNQLNSQIPYTMQPAGTHYRSESVQKLITGQKYLTETPLTPSSSKKQKVSEGSPGLSIKQLNDVTACSGINLGEEEQHLFSDIKKDSQVSEASRKVVQKEARLILQRAPLRKKLHAIMLKGGVTSIGNNVEQCLSMCVEERMLQLIRALIRQSKQRINTRKPNNDCVFLTSDIRQQILILNKKSKEECTKKQAETEKMWKLRENESNSESFGGEENEKCCGKANKTSREEIKMKATTANATARASIGGNDLQLKWQLMADQQQVLKKHRSSSAALSSSQCSSGSSNKVCDMGMGSDGYVAPGSARKYGKAQAAVAPSPTKVDKTISRKNVIAVLEKEPQMSKSSILNRLYFKAPDFNSSNEKSKAL